MKKLGFLALLLLPLLVLYGCGSSSSGSSSSSSQETGSMTFSAKFPQSGKAGEIGSAFISNATQCIEVYVEGQNYYKQVVLTPSNPTATVPGVPIGLVGVMVNTYDGPESEGECSGDMIDQLTAAATVVVGSNTFTATLIGAGWQFASSIPLNKTLSNSTELATAFIVDPLYYYGGMGKAAINDQKPNFRNEYGITWVGNFVSTYNGYPIDRKNCDPSDTACSGDTLHYFVQFIGPNTSNNAVDNGQLQLLPAAEYPNTISYGYDGVETNRFAFFFGIPFGFDYSNTIRWDGEPVYGGGPTMANTPSDTDAMPEINALATTRVTGANTMSGNIVEVLLKDWTPGETTCTVIYDGWSGTNPNQVVTCPSWVGGTSKKVSKEAINKAVLKATSQAVGKAATIGSDGCFTEDITLDGLDKWTDWADVWDGSQGMEGSDNYLDQILIEESWTAVGEVCRTAFTATATEQNIVFGIQ